MPTAHVTVGHIGSYGSRERATDLSVMMLGFTVTTSVFTPTSTVYFSEMGGRLHLQKRQVAQLRWNHSAGVQTVAWGRQGW